MSKITVDIEKGRAGMFFEDFLKELGVYEEATERAMKRVLQFLTARKEIKKCLKSGNSQTA